MKNYKKSTISMFAIVALFVSVWLLGAVSQAAPAQQRVIITFDHEINDAARNALKNRGGHILKDLSIVNGLVVLVPEQAIPGLESIIGVEAVEKDIKVFALKPPGGCDPWPECKNNGDGDDEEPTPEPIQTIEWGVNRIAADLAWENSTGAGIKVAIIDTGIDKDHADLIANIKGGINFIGKNPVKPADPNKWDDDNGHGTHVAGIVAAANNNIGVVGVAPEAQLYAVKALDRNGSGYVSDIISGIEWAIAEDMDVINMSLGASTDVQAFHDAVDNAYLSGIVVVAAAGNSGDGDNTTNEVEYPAKYSSVIAVGATDSDDSTPYWSSEGEEVEVSAPGVDIKSTYNDGVYTSNSGTSMASPHTAGTVALMLSTAVPAVYDADSDGSWDPAEVRTVLQATANDLGATGHDNFYGYGLIDAEESIIGSQEN